jgi:hypothetical protein
LEVLAPYCSGEPLNDEDLRNLVRDYREQLYRNDAVELLWENDLLGVETAEGEVVYPILRGVRVTALLRIRQMAPQRTSLSPV